MCDCGAQLMHDSVQEKMKDFPDWECRLDERGQYLFRHFDFGNKKEDSFLKAKLFVDKVSYIAGKFNHHPDTTFGWGYCDIVLFTHTYKGLTQVDFDMAKEINSHFSTMN